MLLNEKSKTFYKDNPFTGIGFKMHEGIVIAASEYKEGEKLGKYVNQYLPNYENQQIIDSECINPENEDDYESFYCIEDERFSGIALEFDDEFCTGELLYTEGWLDSEVTYYKSGDLEGVELVEMGFSQIYRWSHNGEMNHFEISENGQFSIKLVYDNNKIATLGLSGNYFKRIDELSGKYFFRLLILIMLF